MWAQTLDGEWVNLTGADAMSTQRLTPETAPAGTRVLCRNRQSSRDEMFEATVLEWSAAGRVKLRHDPSGMIEWRETPPLVAEILG